jgi:tetratricopeptide (TPR) repeat protein
MVRAWQEAITIPTYKTGRPDKNPLFLEKRVYQGSSGAVYPHAVIDKVFDEKEEKIYQAVFMENEYLKIMILPELGGRVQMALDKTNNYHFVYYNQVIKPALVGLAGPWISGGIEFNWPQHHRPSTFDPVDFDIEENADGSKTVWVNEFEQMSHTKGMAGFTLYPGKAYLEIKGRLYNRTALAQTFLWWANPAVSVDEHYQSVFPPDVQAVYDHGKRDVSSFPIATGTYYKVDYSPGTDISWYKNIPVPTSYMAVNSAFDFVGGYHHGKQAGILHVANHHVSPGKKQWTWGCGEFGRAWDRHLTDEDGPYFELMTGLFTDNQPDFSWIMPNEERSFCQYFMPYKNIGYVKNATIDAAVNLETKEGTVSVKVYVTAKQERLSIRLWKKNEVVFQDSANLDPFTTYQSSFKLEEECKDTVLKLEVLDRLGHLLVEYTPAEKKDDALPEPAVAIGEPDSIGSTEELFMAARHLEQYRHATFSPRDYYEEALRRDPSDIRNNQGLGTWYLRRGKFDKAVAHYETAIRRLTRHNPNPYDTELYYLLGLALFHQRKYDAAYEAFYKTYWTNTWQDNGALYLARIDCIRKKYTEALQHVNRSIQKNSHGFHARHLKVALLRLMGRYDQALELIRETLRMDPFQFGMIYEQCLILMKKRQATDGVHCMAVLKERMRSEACNYIEIALDYANAGLFEDAMGLLETVQPETGNPIVCYYLSYMAALSGETGRARTWFVKAQQIPVGPWFSNRLEDIEMFRHITSEQPEAYKAWYYLGNIWYDKRQYAEAIECWKRSAEANDRLATVHRNLGIAHFNILRDAAGAIEYYERAFETDSTDARILFELDHLYKKTNKAPADRLAFLIRHEGLVQSRDDLFTEYVTLFNLLGHHERAASLLSGRNFHPWEGGEGKVSGQYVIAKVELAKEALAIGEFASAVELLESARTYPENLGEGKLFGTPENDILYWLALAYDGLGESQRALELLEDAATGNEHPAPAIFYNDPSPDKITYQAFSLNKLHRHAEAKGRLQRLISYGRAHVNDQVKIDYFAVSLPDLVIFDEDLNRRNRIHCLYMEGLGHLGLREWDEATRVFGEVLFMDASHMGATIHLRLARDQKRISPGVWPGIEQVKPPALL